MTTWKPILDPQQPLYLALADGIAADLRAGRLQPGERLPTHRELADVLGTTVGTISRGYAEAERRGLTTGEVGRGTFLRGSLSTVAWPEAPTSAGIVDLSFSLPVSLPEEGELLAQALLRIARDPQLDRLLAYHADSALPHHRAAGAHWLARLGLEASADSVLVTAGSQHGLNVILSSVFVPGQVLLTEALTYPSLKSQARNFGIRLRGVELDEEGIDLEALERACQREPRPKGLYVVPTLQNPTSAIMSVARRQAIAELARTHDLWIVEDDVHGMLLREPIPPIACFAPERTIYSASLAKCLVPGLRTGFLLGPPELRPRLLTGIHTSLWMAPPLMVELAAQWLGDGTADRLMQAKREETERRQRLAAHYLQGQSYRRHPSGYQIWLELPEPWGTDEFVSQAREQGIKLVGASAFAVNRSMVPHAVRLTLGQPSGPDLDRGLCTLKRILDGTRPATY